MARKLDATRISPLDLRAHLGELLDRVRLRRDAFVVERRGVEIAAIVPIERLRQLEDFARDVMAKHWEQQAGHLRQLRVSEDQVERDVDTAVARLRARRRKSR
jgi:prevent-host-death family protein